MGLDVLNAKVFLSCNCNVSRGIIILVQSTCSRLVLVISHSGLTRTYPSPPSTAAMSLWSRAARTILQVEKFLADKEGDDDLVSSSCPGRHWKSMESYSFNLCLVSEVLKATAVSWMQQCLPCLAPLTCHAHQKVYAATRHLYLIKRQQIRGLFHMLISRPPGGL